MGNIISIVSQKGGAGKTTLALNLATSLAEQRKSVLLADLDPQGGIGLSLARGETAFEGLTEVMSGKLSASDAIVRTKLESLSLLPRGRLDPIDAAFFEESIHQPGWLESILWPLAQQFDLVILDTPSGLGLPARAALAISDFALVPAQAEPLALRSINQVLRVIEHVAAHENPRLKFLGIVISQLDLRKDASRAVAEELWGGFSGVLESTIPRTDIIQTASQRGLPLSFLGGAQSPEARRFGMLAIEVLSLIAKLKGDSDGQSQQADRQLL